MTVMMLSMYLLLAFNFESQSSPSRAALHCENQRLNYADRYNISARALRAF